MKKEKRLKITPEYLKKEYLKFIDIGKGKNTTKMDGEVYCRLDWLRPRMKNTLIIWMKF